MWAATWNPSFATGGGGHPAGQGGAHRADPRRRRGERGGQTGRPHRTAPEAEEDKSHLDILLGNKPKEPELPPRNATSWPCGWGRVKEQLQRGELEHMLVEVEVEETTPKGEIPAPTSTWATCWAPSCPRRPRCAKSKCARRQDPARRGRAEHDRHGRGGTPRRSCARSRTAWCSSTRRQGGGPGFHVQRTGCVARGRTAGHSAHRGGLHRKHQVTGR
jgi:hypothetical protein